MTHSDTHSDNGESPCDDERAVSLDRALAETQRLERDERDADIKRQQNADDRMIEALRKD